MIRLDSISKQNGHQIVFIEASATLQKGEKAGLVGPNGSGKTAALLKRIAAAGRTAKASNVSTRY